MAGSYYCTCDEGFVGNGETCLPDLTVPYVLSAEQVSPTAVLIHWKSNDTSGFVGYQAMYKLLIENPTWQKSKMQTSLNSTFLLRNLTIDSTYCVQIIAFSVHNISIKSKKYFFKVQENFPLNPIRKDKTVTIAVSVTAALVLVAVIAVSFCCVQRRREKKRNPPQQAYPPALEDLIEMRTHPTASNLTHNEKLVVELPGNSK